MPATQPHARHVRATEFPRKEENGTITQQGGGGGGWSPAIWSQGRVTRTGALWVQGMMLGVGVGHLVTHRRAWLRRGLGRPRTGLELALQLTSPCQALWSCGTRACGPQVGKLMSSQLGKKTQAPTCRGGSAEAPGHRDSCATQQARPLRPPQVHRLERCSGWKWDVPGAEMEEHTVSLRLSVY